MENTPCTIELAVGLPHSMGERQHVSSRLHCVGEKAVLRHCGFIFHSTTKTKPRCEGPSPPGAVKRSAVDSQQVIGPLSTARVVTTSIDWPGMSLSASGEHWRKVHRSRPALNCDGPGMLKQGRCDIGKQHA